jgi:hypothetical protein
MFHPQLEIGILDPQPKCTIEERELGIRAAYTPDALYE